MKGILFVCKANSARSQMAEGIARAVAPPGVRIFSAGSMPGRLHPLAVRALAEIGISREDLRSKGFDAVPEGAYDLMVTLCEDGSCPVLPSGCERLHWPLPDPASGGEQGEEPIEAFRRVRDELRRRIEGLLG